MRLDRGWPEKAVEESIKGFSMWVAKAKRLQNRSYDLYFR